MDVNKIAIIGAGSMGSMMALLFAEKGLEVIIEDPSEDSRKAAFESAKITGLDKQISTAKNYEEMCKALSTPRVVIMSLPHGETIDVVLQQLLPWLEKGDYVIDASNERWDRTERRQGLLVTKDCHFIGMGVSGGYQSARTGPSMSPGGESAALDQLLPFLSKAAAKDHNGNPCVAKIGSGGAGHYTKTIHNGIEHGVMSGLCEVWAIMHHGLGMPYSEMADVFEKWDSGEAGPELKDNFLISISVDINREMNPEDNQPVLSKIKDKVVQDIDDSEGTGPWTLQTAAELHIPHPTISAGHSFRLGSGYAAQRSAINEKLGGPFASMQPFTPKEGKEQFLEHLRLATYAMFLSAFIQGLEILQASNAAYRWNMDFSAIVQIWRAGCIIRSGYISDLLAPVYAKDNDANIATTPEICADVKKSFPSLRTVVLQAMENDHIVPTLSASLDYYRYMSVKEDLPTRFQEAQLDYFGKHMFDLRGDPPGEPVTGTKHFEWKPPKGLEGKVREMTKM